MSEKAPKSGIVLEPHQIIIRREQLLVLRNCSISSSSISALSILVLACLTLGPSMRRTYS